LEPPITSDIISATFSGGMTPVNNCSAFSGANEIRGATKKLIRKVADQGFQSLSPNNSESCARFAN